MTAYAIMVYRNGQSAIADNEAKEYNPVYSPDGRRLAFQRIVDASEYVDGRPCTMATWLGRSGRREPAAARRAPDR